MFTMKQLLINLQKYKNNSRHLLTPKVLLRYAPGSMRNEESGSRLDPTRAFSLNRLDDINNFPFTKAISESCKIKAKIVNPVFFDPNGVRKNGI